MKPLQIFVLLMVMVMIFSVVGCSSSDEPNLPNVPIVPEDENDDEEEKENTGDPEDKENTGDADSGFSDDFLELTNTFHLASNFSELEYTYSVTDASNQKDVTEYAFDVLDEKSVDGKTAYHISFKRSSNGNQSTTECWVNEEQVLAVIEDGEEVTDELKLMQTNNTLNTLMAPFIFTVVYEEILLKPQVRTIMGWTLEDEGTKSVVLSGRSYTVYYFELLSRGGENAYFEVASIGGKNIFLSYETTKEGKHYMFNIVHMISR